MYNSTNGFAPPFVQYKQRKNHPFGWFSFLVRSGGLEPPLCVYKPFIYAIPSIFVYDLCTISCVKIVKALKIDIATIVPFIGLHLAHFFGDLRVILGDIFGE